MSTSAAFVELQELVKATWPWTSAAKGGGGQFRDVQVKRVKWLEFLQSLESDPPVDLGMSLPLVIEEFNPWTPDNGPDGWGYAGNTLSSACNLFLVDELPDPQTVSVVGTGGMVGIDDTLRYFVGQRLKNFDQGTYHEVVSVDSATGLTLDSNAGIGVNDLVGPFDMTELLEREAMLLSAALTSPNLSDNFFTVDNPVIDSSSLNPANVALAKSNYAMQAVQLTFTLYVSA